LRVPSPCRPRRRSAGLAEVYSAVVIVAITVALASLVYSGVRFSPEARPVYSFESYSVLGDPSVLHLQINSSMPSEISELRLDDASSLSGILALTPSGYVSVGELCGSGVTTFFSVNTTAGSILISGGGQAWIDGVAESGAQVSAGIHELMIADASACTIALPGGLVAAYPSPWVSTIPRIGQSELDAVVLVPYSGTGHSVTAVFGSGVEVFDF